MYLKNCARQNPLETDVFFHSVDVSSLFTWPQFLLIQSPLSSTKCVGVQNLIIDWLRCLQPISVPTPPTPKKNTKKTRTWAKFGYFWDVLNFGFLQQSWDFGFPIFTNVWGFEVSSVSAKRSWNVERPGPGIGKRIGKRGRWPYLVTRVVVSNMCLFSPRYLGKGFPFWRAYCSNGLQPPTSNGMSTLGL